MVRIQEYTSPRAPQKALGPSNRKRASAPTQPGRGLRRRSFTPMRYSPKPASWDEREGGGAVLPTMGLTTAGDPGPRSIKLSSVTSLSTCGSRRCSEPVSPGALAEVKPAGTVCSQRPPIQEPGAHCGPGTGEPCPLPLRMCLLALPQQLVNSASCSVHQIFASQVKEQLRPPRRPFQPQSRADAEGVLTPLLAFWTKRPDRNRSNLSGRRAP